MADAKDTIDNVERCLCHIQDACMLCPHIEGDATEDCMENLMRDALEAMKSQQERIDNMRSLLGEADEEIRRLKEIAKNGNGFIEKCDSRTAQMFSH